MRGWGIGVEFVEVLALCFQLVGQHLLEGGIGVVQGTDTQMEGLGNGMDVQGLCDNGIIAVCQPPGFLVKPIQPPVACVLVQPCQLPAQLFIAGTPCLLAAHGSAHTLDLGQGFFLKMWVVGRIAVTVHIELGNGEIQPQGQFLCDRQKYVVVPFGADIEEGHIVLSCRRADDGSFQRLLIRGLTMYFDLDGSDFG